MMNPVPWLQMTNMISYQGLVRTFLRYTFKWAPEKIKVGYSAQNIETLDSELISESALTVIDPVSGESKTFEDGKIIDPGEVGAAYLVPVVKQLLRRLDDLENAMRN
ncbi:hypothetical protein ACCH78_001214 [Enterobacter hormaechei]